jgi:hypothetical protein
MEKVFALGINLATDRIFFLVHPTSSYRYDEIGKTE